MSLSSVPGLVGYPQRELSSRNSKSLSLPRIEHPSKRMNSEEKSSLDIRGRSRDGQGNGKLIRNEIESNQSPRRRRRTSSSSSFQSNCKSLYRSEQLDQIPENIQTVYGEDRDKVRLPIFGKRNLSFASSNSISSS